MFERICDSIGYLLAEIAFSLNHEHGRLFSLAYDLSVVFYSHGSDVPLPDREEYELGNFEEENEKYWSQRHAQEKEEYEEERNAEYERHLAAMDRIREETKSFLEGIPETMYEHLDNIGVMWASEEYHNVNHDVYYNVFSNAWLVAKARHLIWNAEKDGFKRLFYYTYDGYE